MDEEFNTNDELESHLIDHQLSDQFFKSLAENPYALDYLKATMNADKVRYFAAGVDSQDLIRGHHDFARYLHSKLVKMNGAQLAQK